MATIVTRSGKGSPLTNTEVDSNFTNLNTDKIEDAPSDGTTYARQSGAWAAVTAAAATITTSSTAPSSPSDGDVWYSESNGVTYVYYDDGTSSQWVATGAPTGSLGGFNSLAEMSDVNITSPQDEDTLIYDSGTSKWVNQTPVIEQWQSGTVTFGANRDAIITSGWSRIADINGSVTYSSGVFTFPSTGQWLIRVDFTFSGQNSGTRPVAVLGGSLEVTTNNGTSYSNVTGNSFADRAFQTSSNSSHYNNGSGTISYFFDVTSTSTHKVRIRYKSDADGETTDKLQVHIIFQRVANT